MRLKKEPEKELLRPEAVRNEEQKKASLMSSLPVSPALLKKKGRELRK